MLTKRPLTGCIDFDLLNRFLGPDFGRNRAEKREWEKGGLIRHFASAFW